MAVYGIISFMIFFVIYFFFSQKVYSLIAFPLAASLSLIIPFIFILFNANKLNTWILLNIGLLTFYYILFLFFVKLFYKSLNNYFVSKKVINPSFLHKDFTFVILNDLSYGDNIWDSKLSVPPSLLDYIITIALLFLPMLMFMAVLSILK